MEIVEQVKILLGIEDTMQDKLLRIIKDLTEAHFNAFSGEESVPEELEFIVVEVMVKRFNRIGSEGLKTHNIEGLSMDFEINDLAEYEQIIKRYFANRFSAGFKML